MINKHQTNTIPTIPVVSLTVIHRFSGPQDDELSYALGKQGSTRKKRLGLNGVMGDPSNDLDDWGSMT